VFACSFLFVSDLLFWNGIHGKEAGFIRTAGESVLSITRLRESQGRRVKCCLRKVVCISDVERRALVNQTPISNRSASSEQACISFRFLTALWGASEGPESFSG